MQTVCSASVQVWSAVSAAHAGPIGLLKMDDKAAAERQESQAVYSIGFSQIRISKFSNAPLQMAAELEIHSCQALTVERSATVFILAIEHGAGCRYRIAIGDQLSDLRIRDADQSFHIGIQALVRQMQSGADTSGHCQYGLSRAAAIGAVAARLQSKAKVRAEGHGGEVGREMFVEVRTEGDAVHPRLSSRLNIRSIEFAIDSGLCQGRHRNEKREAKSEECGPFEFHEKEGSFAEDGWPEARAHTHADFAKLNGSASQRPYSRLWDASWFHYPIFG